VRRDGRSRPMRRNAAPAAEGPLTARTGGTRYARLFRRGLVLAIASATFLVLSYASSSYANAVPPNATVVAPQQHRELPATAIADSAVTPAVSPVTRDFIGSRSDFSRSIVVGRVVIPLLLILLAEAELLSVGGRTGGRVFLAYGLPLIAVFALLASAPIRSYIE
jgi:hypothetical protein